MNTDHIIVNIQSSIKMTLGKIIYFDPFMLMDEMHDADIIFITHNHYDHFDIKSIDKVKNENTIVVAPKSMAAQINDIKFRDYIFLNPNDEINIDDIFIKAIPAYNLEKTFHPRSYDWLGYIVRYNNITYYIAGDTDKTPEAENVKCDIALIPIGGDFTMNVMEASELIKKISPQVVIPTHYGSIVGDINDGKELENNLADTKIMVVEKL